MKPEIIDKIKQHYNHACKKHPDFVKRFGVEDEFDWSEFNLKMYRKKIETETKYNNLGLESILLCEVWEFFDAIVNERFQEAIEEGYDIIAVVLRAIERIKKLKVAENATTTPTCEKSSVVGNAAAMRETLLRCDAIAQLPEIREYKIVKEMRNLIWGVLAKPPRNCDVYQTSWDVITHWDGGLDSAQSVVRMLDWLFAEAKGETDEQ